ncbi:MAG: ribonuclease P protein component, partial [Candidatus Puniceispirillaceae bacterium]
MKTIPSRAGFLAARSKGAKALARGLVIRAVARDSDDWRIGLTATKKIGNAVTRNRAPVQLPCHAIVCSRDFPRSRE